MSEVKMYDYKEQERFVVAEPAVEMMTPAMAHRQMSDYVREDIRIGMEQYRRGEYESAWSFIERLKR